MKIKYYLLSGVFAYLLFVIIMLPAKLALDRLVGKQALIIFNDVTGTLWHGRAQRVDLASKLQLSQVKWDIILWRLLTGELSTTIQANFKQQPQQATISITPTGTLIARDITGQISAKDFARLAQIPFAQLDGQIYFNIDDCYWKHNQAPLANGIINWKNAAITVAETVSLGNIHIRLINKANTSMDVKLSNQGGNLKLNGKANLDNKATYQLDLTMKPTPSATQNLLNSLAVFAKRQNNGSFVIKTNGKLSIPGVI